jgi:class 3 adenylate cyclase/tetratricopeptide (TPR) repeat protein
VISNLRGEERLVTVVFADMSESVRRTSDLDAESATDLVNPLLETMVELMTRYGGRIDRFLGDGILAVFGVPAAHEDDPIRAVWAALELRDRAAELGLPVTVGVNTGRVYFGPVGSNVHEELTVMGPTVNLAARFQSAATAGEVVVGVSTETQARAAFALSPVRLDIKGIAEPVDAFKAERVLDHPDKVRGIEDLRSGLVGRQTELERLQTALATGNAVAVVGVAGVGKSRLAAELHTSVVSNGGKWLEGHCLEITSAIPYAPFRDLVLRDLSSDKPLPALEGSLDVLVASGAMTADRAGEIAPFLAYLAGLRWDDHRDAVVVEAEPELRHALTVDAITAYLAARADTANTVYFVDDIHWADELSLDIVSRIGRSPQPGLLLLVTSRPPSSAWSGDIEATFEEIALEELKREEVKTLVSRLLDADGIPQSLEDRLLDQAQGNPFYVEELIRSLIQGGVISRSDDTWRWAADEFAIEVPPSVEGVLMARFDRLPLSTRRAAKAAAVLGMEVDVALFDALAGPDLVGEPKNLVGAGILAAAGDGYSFIHALTREAIYNSLLPSQRAELHEQAAATLERLRGEELEQIAHHYRASRNDLKAVEYLCRAGEHAVDAFITESAREYLTSGLERVEHLPESDRPAWRGRLHARLGEMLVRLAQHEPAQESLRRALAEMEPDPLEEARVSRLLGQSHRLESNFAAAHDAYDEAETALERVGAAPEAKRAWVDVQRERSIALYFGGRGREVAGHIEKIAPIVEEYGTAAQQSDFQLIHTLQSFVEHRFALSDDTVDMARRASELADAGADPGRAAETRFVLGFTLLWADRLEEAAEVLTSAAAMTGRVGNTTEQCRAQAYRAIALRRLGLVDAAEEAAREAMTTAEAIGSSYYAGHARAVQCWVEWKRGSGVCDQLADETFETWGWEESDGHRGLSCEFGWLAVWPRAADAFRRGETTTAIDHLRLLQVPWERPMPPDLAAQVTAVISTGDGTGLDEVFREAEKHALL